MLVKMIIIWAVLCYLIAMAICYLGMKIGPSFVPKVKANPLSEETRERIKMQGVIHATSVKGMHGIIKDNKIKCSKGMANYCNMGRKSVYFSMPSSYDSKEFNYNKKYKKYLTVIPTDEQLDRMKERAFDSTVLHEGDFDLSKCDVRWDDYVYSNDKKKYNSISRYFLTVRIINAVIGAAIGIGIGSVSAYYIVKLIYNFFPMILK